MVSEKFRVSQNFSQISRVLHRVWKGLRVIWDLAKIGSVIQENKIKSAVIREFYLGCDAGFAFYLWSVSCDFHRQNSVKSIFYSLAQISNSHMSQGAVVIMPHLKHMGSYCTLS